MSRGSGEGRRGDPRLAIGTMIESLGREGRLCLVEHFVPDVGIFRFNATLIVCIRLEYTD